MTTRFRSTLLLGCIVLSVASAQSTSTLKPATKAASPGILYEGPLVIRRGGTYRGNWRSLDPKRPAILIETSEPVIIEHANVAGRGNLIAGFGNRVTIRNVNGYGLNPNVPGQIPGRFANLEEVKNVVIQNSYMQGTSGVYIRDYRGNGTKSETIRITNNKISNVVGAQSDGKGGYTSKRTIAHAILFNQVQRIPGAEIAWNQIINEPGKSLVEENINMYKSSGTPSSPILIHDNYIQGAYNARPWADADYSGGGIVLGDGPIDDPSESGYARAYNNQVVNAVNQGISIMGGVDNRIYGNRIIYSGRLPDGRVIALDHTAGSVVWDIDKQAKKSPQTFKANVLTDNYLAVTNLRADGGHKFDQPTWAPDCKTAGSQCSRNTDGGRVTPQMEKQEYQRWLTKLKSNGIKIGPRNS